MTTVRLKHVHEYKDRHGSVRRYFRKAGMKRVPLPGLPGSPEFMAAYHEASAASPSAVGSSRTTPGTLNALVVRYYGSPAFRSLAPLTKSTYRNIIERLREEHGDKPVNGIERKHVAAIVNRRAETPSAANHLLDIIRVLMRHAIDIGWRDDDPTANVRKLKESGKGHHVWTDEEIAQYESVHPVGTMARLAIAMLKYTAVRRSDVVRIGPRHFRPRGPKEEFDWLAVGFSQEKTNEEVYIPIHPELADIIAATPTVGIDAYIVTAYGKPFSVNGFGNKFREWCDVAGLPHCSAHGVRHHRMTAAAEAGSTAHELLAVGGQKTIAEVQRYTRTANKRRLAGSALRKLVEAGR